MTAHSDPMRDAPAGLAGDLQVIAFALEELNAGGRVALATIVGLDGPFSRPVGAQLAIAGDGRFRGGISGGCLETVVVEAALDCMRQGRNALLRYGAGSPFLDVRLPCGGGLDLAIDVHIEAAELARLIQLVGLRQPAALLLSPGSPDAGVFCKPTIPEPYLSRQFVRRFVPQLRLVIAGRGWEVAALARAGQWLDCEVVVASQEPATLEACRSHAAQTILLKSPTRVPDLGLDQWSAFVCLFHEHEWEAALLLDALRSPAFYVGALGSRPTHLKRLDTLRELGAGPDDVERLRAPIGLFAAREPRMIALSTLAEIASLWQARP